MKASKITQSKRLAASDVVLMLCVGALLFLLVFYAAGMYQRIITAQAHRSNARSGLVTIAGRLHAADGVGKVTTTQTRYGTTLVIAENTDSGMVETRYYKHHHHLYEQTALATDPIDVKKAAELTPTRRFRVAITGNVVTVTTDAGTEHVTLRGGTGA